MLRLPFSAIFANIRRNNCRFTWKLENESFYHTQTAAVWVNNFATFSENLSTRPSFCLCEAFAETSKKLKSSLQAWGERSVYVDEMPVDTLTQYQIFTPNVSQHFPKEYLSLDKTSMRRQKQDHFSTTEMFTFLTKRVLLFSTKVVFRHNNFHSI
jgi:hypothetical protein